MASFSLFVLEIELLGGQWNNRPSEQKTETCALDWKRACHEI